MIPYIGDISKADAIVLRGLAEQSSSILEFGVGASTQVLSYYRQAGLMISIETEQSWIDRTKKNLELLGIKKEVEFYEWKHWLPIVETGLVYDLIFNDGVLSLRKEFAFAKWNNLKIGGILAFHDTRTSEGVKVVLEFIEKFSPEIESVFINIDNSNITVIKKKKQEHYENWTIMEGKEPWEYGYTEVDEEKLKLKLKNHEGL